MKRFRDFLKDRSGATALTFALMLVPIMGMTGLAVDYSVATNERATLQDAADAAALAGASVFTGAKHASCRSSREGLSQGKSRDGQVRCSHSQFQRCEPANNRQPRWPDSNNVHAYPQSGHDSGWCQCTSLGTPEAEQRRDKIWGYVWLLGKEDLDHRRSPGADRRTGRWDRYLRSPEQNGRRWPRNRLQNNGSHERTASFSASTQSSTSRWK